MALRTIFASVLLTSLWGCTPMKHTLGQERWFNASLPIHLQHTMFEQEQQFCVQAADKWIPLPEIEFSYAGVRSINGIANSSVEGTGQLGTYGLLGNSSPTAAKGSGTGVWQKVSASLGKNYRQSRAEKACLTSLGWRPTSDTWDGTPNQLNQTFKINQKVMEAVSAGFTHPVLGDKVIALLDRDRSYVSGKDVVISTSEIPTFGSKPVKHCTYTLKKFLIIPSGEVICDGKESFEVSIELGSPIAVWMSYYY